MPPNSSPLGLRSLEPAITFVLLLTFVVVSALRATTPKLEHGTPLLDVTGGSDVSSCAGFVNVVEQRDVNHHVRRDRMKDADTSPLGPAPDRYNFVIPSRDNQPAALRIYRPTAPPPTP